MSKETGEFVWNLATRALAEAMNATSATVPAEVDEFALAGLGALPSSLVKPDRVAGSPVQFECRLTQLIQLETKEGRALDQWLVIGEAIGIHIDRALSGRRHLSDRPAAPDHARRRPGRLFRDHRRRAVQDAPAGLISHRRARRTRSSSRSPRTGSTL